VRSGSSVNGSTIWDRLNSQGGGYITDYYTNTPRYNDFSPGIPGCDQLPASGGSGGSAPPPPPPSGSPPPSPPPPSPNPQGKAGYSESANADIALRYDTSSGERACADAGTPSPNGLQGTCKQFVNCVVRMASGGRVVLAPGYYSKYAQYGVQVSRDQARRGDIIQLSGGPGDDSFYNGMHTAFVVSYQGGENFEVVYSNQITHQYPNGDRTVHHTTWNPYAQARYYGLNVYIWRIGRV